MKKQSRHAVKRRAIKDYIGQRTLNADPIISIKPILTAEIIYENNTLKAKKVLLHTLLLKLSGLVKGRRQRIYRNLMILFCLNPN